MLAFAMMAAIRHKANQIKKHRLSLKKQQAVPPSKTAAPHPLVHPGNQTYRSTPRAKANKPNPRYRVVTLAKSPSSRRQKRTSKKITTVMLGSGPIKSLHRRGLV
jgi:hypothetical protein